MSFLGIVMLETQFVRPVGDIGNPETFAGLNIPVRYQTVRGAHPARVVRRDGGLDLRPFVEAAQALAASGASLLSTSCGFLARYQYELQSGVAIPVLSSSLMWLISPRLAGRRAGVLTIDADAFDTSQLIGVGAEPTTPVHGMSPGCEFQRRILGNDTGMDLVQAGHDVVSAALQLTARHPDIDVLVLECTNMAPYADAVARATGRRVEHIVSLIEQTWRSMA